MNRHEEIMEIMGTDPDSVADMLVSWETVLLDFKDWWFVRVQLRREDKSLEWQTRAAFKNRVEAELYSHEWIGIALTRMFQANTKDNLPTE